MSGVRRRHGRLPRQGLHTYQDQLRSRLPDVHVSNLALAGSDPDRRSEAQDNFREAWTRTDLKPVADALLDGSANTLLLVDYGSGPEKVAYGPDGSLSKFRHPARRPTVAACLSR